MSIWLSSYAVDVAKQYQAEKIRAVEQRRLAAALRKRPRSVRVRISDLLHWSGGSQPASIPKRPTPEPAPTTAH